ncbi:hypothetical protein BVH74_15020 [Halopseudomonas phragmitis]|uniref:RcnB family protein n=3 Tax=Pseudomonadales TaxID=72274 RepID=A0A1V0BA80_9GAMM|nr:hypothetical protein BVH74_15020 [Halopseudomonas phragmitis]RHW21202.1 hypothetical protein C2846_10595 [Pseudomonas jilinensis]
MLFGTAAQASPFKPATPQNGGAQFQIQQASHNASQNRHHRQERNQRQHRHERHNQQRRHQAVQQHRRSDHHYRAQRHVYHAPPPVHVIRQQVYPKRHYISRGPVYHNNIIIVQGRPMPKGYGKRVSHYQVRHLPHYPGYEWRQVGRDLILVAITTGIVYAILDNVLN